MEEIFAEAQVYTGEPEPGSNLIPLPQAPMMQTKTQYHTAVRVQKPRDLDKVVAAVMREADLAGENFYWHWPVKEKNKETGKYETKILCGPSIGLTLAVAREWTNVAIPIDLQETATQYVFNAHFVDLEKGFTITRIFRKTKNANKDLAAWGADRAEDMTFQAAQSRALRNVISAGVPRWLLNQAIDRAKEAVAKKITPEKLAFARAAAIKTFATYGVNEARIVALLNVPLAQWASDEIVILQGLLQQLKDGQSTANELFPPIEEGEKSPEKKKPGRPPKAQESPPTPQSSDPQGEVQNTEKSFPGAVQGITSDTLEAIRSGLSEKSLDLALAYHETGIEANYKLTELDEASAVLVKNWIEQQ